MKRNKLMKSLLSLLLASTMVFLAACGGGTGVDGTTKNDGTTKSDGTTKGNDASSSEEVSGKIDRSGSNLRLNEKVTLDVTMVTDSNVVDFETNLLTKMLEEGTNVDLNFHFLPAGADAKQKLSVMISGNDTLTDIIIMSMTPLETYSYGSQGYFLGLTDLIESTSINLKGYLDSEEGQESLPYVKSPDGEIYGYPRWAMDLGNDWDRRMWINQTWLDSLNLEMPTTTEEYTEVLRAFRDGDPNGNGKEDEIPLIGNTDGWNQSVWKTMLNAFTYVNDNFDYIQMGDDGKLQLSYAQPEWKAGLEWLNQLHDEDLLSPLTFTQDQNQFKQIIDDPEEQVVGSITGGSMSIYQVESKRKEDMTHMPPLTGPEDVRLTSYRNSMLPDAFGFITKDCDDPEAAAVLFDYFYDRDVTLHGRFGEVDVDWKTPGDDAVGLYEDLGYEPMIEYINPIWGTVQNTQWGENHPALRTYDMICGVVYSGNPFDSQYMTAQAIPDYRDLSPEDVVTRLIYTQEEAEAISEILATLSSYRDEMVAAFVTGNRSFSEWDAYISELDAIGMAEYLEVAQTAYERMNS